MIFAAGVPAYAAAQQQPRSIASSNHEIDAPLAGDAAQYLLLLLRVRGDAREDQGQAYRHKISHDGSFYAGPGAAA